MAERHSIRKSVTESCADILRNEILNGKFDTPRSFVIDRVAERLKVSQTPIREAVRKLESEGLLEYSRGRGVIIRKLHRDEFDELVDLRRAIEPILIAAACRSARDRDIAEARKQLEKWMKLQGSRPERYEGQHQVTASLYATTRLTRTIEALETVTALIARYHVFVWQSSTQVYQTDFDFISEMLNQIEAGDAEAATAAFTRRMTWAAERVRDQLVHVTG